MTGAKFKVVLTLRVEQVLGQDLKMRVSLNIALLSPLLPNTSPGCARMVITFKGRETLNSYHKYPHGHRTTSGDAPRGFLKGPLVRMLAWKRQKTF